MCSRAALGKHFPGIFEFQALSRCGVHWKIQRRDKTILLTTRMTIEAHNGRMKLLDTVMRRRNRQIDTLVNINVAKVYESHGQLAPLALSR